MLGVIERQRLVLALPFWVGTIVGGVFDAVQSVTLGLVPNRILTRDQVKSLRSDSVVSEGAMGFAEMEIETAGNGVGFAGLPLGISPVRRVCDDQKICTKPRRPGIGNSSDRQSTTG